MARLPALAAALALGMALAACQPAAAPLAQSGPPARSAPVVHDPVGVPTPTAPGPGSGPGPEVPLDVALVVAVSAPAGPTPQPTGTTRAPTRAPAPASGAAEAAARTAAAAQPVSTRSSSSAAGRQRTAGSLQLGCFGDGTDGPRVQGLRLVGPGGAGASQAQAAQWAADVEATVDASAVRTGGRRHVRFVTDTGKPGCRVAAPLVTLAAADLGSLAATIAALRTRGYDRADRKYLLWADADVYCGIATTFLDDRAVGNANDGGAAQYARVDRTCWGGGETHELLHAFGAVQPGAPHGDADQHCTDGADVMCLRVASAGGCPPAELSLLDCHGDDYFSTAPAPGSWLATHWNTADSVFLSDRLDDAAPPPSSAPTPSPSRSPCRLLSLGRC